MIVAHVSDLHLDGTGPRRARAVRVGDHLRALNPAPDVVVVTGDVADHGLPAEYDEARDVLDGLAPLVVPGNHDDRDALTAAFGPTDRVSRTDGLSVALLDTLVPGQGHGELSDGALRLVAGIADEPGPVVVALHHPPMPVGHPTMDRISLRDPASLEAVLRRRSGPTLVLCGHLHMPIVTTFAGHPLVVAPGVASTLRSPEEPGEGPVRDPSEPGLALHRLAPGSPPLTVFRTPA
ncbi:metallophosphoesterase [Pseudonocardia endophytica]|uniref:3',5'-cyclic AMP phosphodiesterase CpdA n=1 Tax=Pseudonocardia endophytica TaxID=401976 RepID=A0A4R1HUW2_PSEEN|nr:metallophosphoesterase [Pseudonocardia endophytica]TCK24765.1 3',5'-cyclic AMP phosphodiesterase CpdA [Pseudonocardia endophytica]